MAAQKDATLSCALKNQFNSGFDKKNTQRLFSWRSQDVPPLTEHNIMRAWLRETPRQMYRHRWTLSHSKQTGTPPRVSDAIPTADYALIQNLGRDLALRVADAAHSLADEAAIAN